ncbi:MAG: hypothetical protein AAGD01_17945 [Acidobacteriota bacterium]
MAKQRFSLVSLALLAGLPLFAEWAPPAHAKGAYPQGQRVEFTGVVTDRDGRPLQDLKVTLEAIRTEFDWLELRKAPVDRFRFTTDTSAGGSYSLPWKWNEYYDEYEIVVWVPVRRGQEEEIRELVREEITERAESGTPVLIPLVVPDTTFLNAYRRFLAGVDSEDEQRIFEQLGQPDKIEELVAPEGPKEESWWYFEAGRMFRFDGGQLVEEKRFAPIEPIQESSTDS